MSSNQTVKKTKTQEENYTVTLHVAEIRTDSGLQPLEFGTIWYSSPPKQQFSDSSICAAACESGTPRRGVHMRKPITKAQIFIILYARALCRPLLLFSFVD